MKMTIILVFILILTLVLASVTVILSGLIAVSDAAYSVPAVEEGLRSNPRAWVGRVISIRGTVTNARSICARGRSCAIPHWAVDPGCHAPCTVASWEEVGQVVSVPVPPLRKTAPWWTIYVGGRYGGRQFIPVARLILQPSSRPLPSPSPPSLYLTRARPILLGSVLRQGLASSATRDNHKGTTLDALSLSPSTTGASPRSRVCAGNPHLRRVPPHSTIIIRRPL